MLGVLSCNALLGIGDASLHCDTDPCPPDVASIGELAGPRAPDDATPGAAEPSASTGASDDGVIVGVPPLQSPSGGAASGPAAAPEDGAPSSGGGESGGATGEGAAGSGGAAAQPPPPDAGSSIPTASACDRDDACGLCLCGACREEFDACDRTPGCIEILACARLTGCTGFDCYCGSVSALACGSSGRGNGPCLDVTLAAPGSREPTLANPSAGPASDAALAFGNCAAQDALCISACRN